MSRTVRKARPTFYRDGKRAVRDGATQYVSVHCQHHNACPWCANGRTHSSRRRAPIVEVSA